MQKRQILHTTYNCVMCNVFYAMCSVQVLLYVEQNSEVEGERGKGQKMQQVSKARVNWKHKVNELNKES